DITQPRVLESLPGNRSSNPGLSGDESPLLFLEDFSLPALQLITTVISGYKPPSVFLFLRVQRRLTGVCLSNSDRVQNELPSPVVRDDEVTVAARRRSMRKKVFFPSPDSSPIASTVTPARSMMRNTPASLFRQAVTPRVPDVSTILAPAGRTPRYTHTPRHGRSSVNLDDSDWTNQTYFSPISGLGDTSFFTEDITNLSSALLKEDDPGDAAAASLFPEFLGSFLKHSSSAVVRAAGGLPGALPGQGGRSAVCVLRAGQNSKTAGVRWLLQQENCSWRLITSLYRDRVPSESEKVVVEQLFQRDAAIRQSQLVVDWLESIAKDQIGDFSDNIEYYAKNVCW
ncbi:hypothetical protein KUCAC02_031793, partial [Chaenocephalus aceratus]